MKKILNFSNSGILSLLDITTMGDSVKRNDDSKTGKFDSGLKYAIAILLRNNVDFYILSGKKKYTFSTIDKTIDNKTKKLIVVNERHTDTEICEQHVTAFAYQLGHDWDFWMAIRELYSNCMDENGMVYDSFNNFDTQIILDANNHHVNNIIENWNSYFIGHKPKLFESNNITVYENTSSDELFRIYKNGVLVYTSKNTKSKYVYDVHDCSIDERRQLLNKGNAEIDISYALRSCKLPSFISKFLNDYDSEYYEGELMNYGSYSDAWVTCVNKAYEEKTLPILHLNMLSDMYKDNRFELNKKSISSGSQWFSPEVLVEKVPVKLSFLEAVEKSCKDHNLELRYPIVESKLSNSFKVVADTRNKLLYIDRSFTEEHLWMIIKEQIRLDGKDTDEIYKEYLKLLNK